MKRLPLFLAILTGTTLFAAPARWQLQSNPWVNLHQRLLYEVQVGTAPSADASLQKFVDAYRKFLGTRSPLFDKELVDLNTALSATTGNELPASIPKAAAEVLEAAMPVYRAKQWEDDDRANRFWIALAEPMLASAGEELAGAHEKAYGVPFPKRILVDVSALAWKFGAYTVGEGEFAHAVIASTDRANQGFGALESLVHEPSHAIVDSSPDAAIGKDLARLSKELGFRPYANLWHAILFYTSGELTRRALARRGVVDYKPMMLTLNMYDGPFRGMRQSLETHWQAWLDGKGTREEALRQIFIETAPPKKN